MEAIDQDPVYLCARWSVLTSGEMLSAQEIEQPMLQTWIPEQPEDYAEQSLATDRSDKIKTPLKCRWPSICGINQSRIASNSASSPKITIAGKKDTMTKTKPIPTAELVAAIADTHGCSQAAARLILDNVQSAVSGLIADGKVVRLSQLATFTPVDVPQRQVRNPATGEMQTAAPTRQVRISATGPLKAAVKAGS